MIEDFQISIIYVDIGILQNENLGILTYDLVNNGSDCGWWRFYFIVRNRSKQAAFGMWANWLVFNTDDNGIVE